jgi:hypothetical protein
MADDAVLRIVIVLRQDGVDRADQEGTEEQCQQQNLEGRVLSRAKMQNRSSHKDLNTFLYFRGPKSSQIALKCQVEVG